MSLSLETLAVAKTYTDDSISGTAGALAGKNCKIQSITDITGGKRVTFEWTDDSSVSRTSTMDVFNGINGQDGQDGEKGDDGLGIKSVAVNSSNHLIVTYDDDTTEDAGEITLDTSDFVQKSSTAGLLKNDGTVDTTDYTVVSYTQTYSQSGQKIGEITIDGTTTDVVAPTGGGSEHGIPSGGTSGQILSKKSSTDYDVQWTDAGTASQEQADWNEADSSKVDYIKNKPNNLVQDANYVHTDYNYDATAKGIVDGIPLTIQQLQGSLLTKVDKVQGKGLSTNDYTDADQTALQTTIPLEISQLQASLLTKADASSVPTALSDLTDDSTHRVVTDTEKTTWSGKQDALTFDNAPTSNSNNPVKSGGIKTAIDNSFSASETEIRDTVGWTGKNAFWGITGANKSGISYTKTSNGYRIVNAISDAYGNAYTDFSSLKKNTDYKLTTHANITSGEAKIEFYGSNDGTTFSTQIANSDEYSTSADIEVSFNTGTYNYIRVRLFTTRATASASDITYENLMLRKASISDSTYEPYHASVEEEINQVYADNAVLGAKNLLVYPYKSVTKTAGGITFTVNSDGSITISGQATETVAFVYADDSSSNDRVKSLLGKSLLFSGVPQGESRIYQQMSAWGGTSVYDYGDGTQIDIPSNASGVAIQLKVNSGADLTTPVTIYPMLRLASDPDSTYQPYAMTNRELTEAVSNIPTVSVSHSGTASSTTARKQQITVNNVAYDVDGSAYMEQEVILSTSADTVVTFTNNELIVDGKMFTVATSIWDLVPTSIVTSTGSCVITLPKQTNAATIGVRLYVR